NYNYTAGTFTAGSGTVIYTGTESQVVAPLTYNHLSFTKSTEVATINSPVIVNGNFTTSVGGEVATNADITVAGNITLGAGTTLTENSVIITIAGNWLNNGLFSISNGTVNFNGSAAQAVNATVFNKLVVNKSAGALTLTGNLSFNSDLTVTAGTLDLVTYTANRSNVGGTFILGASTLLKASGANNFPQNFITATMNASSTVEYYGTIAQTVASADYGNLTFSNGGSTPKTFVDNMSVNGNFLINSGATVDPNFSTITLAGNFTNSGTYTPSGSTLYLTGVSKTLTGSTTFYTLLVGGSYVVSSGTSSLAGDLFIQPASSLNFGSNNVSLDGDLTVYGSLTSNGVATFTGTRVQTLQIVNAIVSASTGVINFNGTVAPVLNSNTSPTFATLNINNTAGITPSVPWTVYFACNIAAGASFNGGALTHTFYGNFINNGTVTSSGELRFLPSPPFSSAATIKLDGVSFVSTGKVIFGGTSPITITNVNPAFYIVSVTNTNVAGINPPTGWTITNELFISNGATFNGGSAISHTLAGNVTNNGTLNGQTSTITFTGTPAEINGLGDYDFYNLTIAASADLVLNRAINISRNLVVDGLFTTDGRPVMFDGTTASVISGLAGSVTFDNLEQNKTAATTTLSVPVLVNSELTLTDGIINTTAVNLLTLADNAISSSGTATSFVDGPMKKIGNDTFAFPLGDATFWARLEITPPASVTDAYTAQYFATAYSNTTSMAASPSPVLNNVSSLEYWTCSRTTGTSNVNVKLYWESASRSVIQNYTADLVVARWNGSAWANAGQSAVTPSSPGAVSSNTITSFTVFTFGSLSGASPLPIELLTFNAALNNNQQVDLTWSTASETNNAYFTIEKTSDGIHYETVAVVNGAGNSTQVLHYSAVDVNPYSGVSYYRLKQTDFNGMYSYSDLVAITIENSSTTTTMSIYPNPGNGATVHITMNVVEGQEIVVTITDALGKINFYKNISTTENGKVNYEIKPEQQLSPGIYFVTATTEGKVFSQKLIVE
ncbi:MAG: T9SS type A sorting domain-containing protein, partial [Bacteroidota bacterium]|nr:T9SS type A sorting domain-containing protein [Bacteroidota bacterium]